MMPQGYSLPVRGVVRHQDLKRVVGYNCGRLFEVAVFMKTPFAPIFHAEQYDGLSVPAECHGFVQQKAKADVGMHLLQACQIRTFRFRRFPPGVVAIIMVSQYGELTHRRLQTGKSRDPSIHFRGAVVDQVTGEQDDIAVLVVDEVQSFLHSRCIRKAAGVDVRYLRNGKAIEGLGKIGKRYRFLPDAIKVAATRDAEKHDQEHDRGYTYCHLTYPCRSGGKAADQPGEILDQQYGHRT